MCVLLFCMYHRQIRRPILHVPDSRCIVNAFRADIHQWHSVWTIRCQIMVPNVCHCIYRFHHRLMQLAFLLGHWLVFFYGFRWWFTGFFDALGLDFNTAAWCKTLVASNRIGCIFAIACNIVPGFFLAGWDFAFADTAWTIVFTKALGGYRC